MYKFKLVHIYRIIVLVRVYIVTKMAGMNKRLAGVLHEERCILSLPGPLRGPSLPSETVDTVFFLMVLHHSTKTGKIS